jgi:hypothetical protein
MQGLFCIRRDNAGVVVSVPGCLGQAAYLFAAVLRGMLWFLSERSLSLVPLERGDDPLLRRPVASSPGRRFSCDRGRTGGKKKKARRKLSTAGLLLTEQCSVPDASLLVPKQEASRK